MMSDLQDMRKRFLRAKQEKNKGQMKWIEYEINKMRARWEKSRAEDTK